MRADGGEDADLNKLMHHTSPSSVPPIARSTTSSPDLDDQAEGIASEQVTRREQLRQLKRYVVDGIQAPPLERSITPDEDEVDEIEPIREIVVWVWTGEDLLEVVQDDREEVQGLTGQSFDYKHPDGVVAGFDNAPLATNTIEELEAYLRDGSNKKDSGKRNAGSKVIKKDGDEEKAETKSTPFKKVAGKKRSGTKYFPLKKDVGEAKAGPIVLTNNDTGQMTAGNGSAAPTKGGIGDTFVGTTCPTTTENASDSRRDMAETHTVDNTIGGCETDMENDGVTTKYYQCAEEKTNALASMNISDEAQLDGLRPSGAAGNEEGAETGIADVAEAGSVELQTGGLSAIPEAPQSSAASAPDVRSQIGGAGNSNTDASAKNLSGDTQQGISDAVKMLRYLVVRRNAAGKLSAAAGANTSVANRWDIPNQNTDTGGSRPTTALVENADAGINQPCDEFSNDPAVATNLPGGELTKRDPGPPGAHRPSLMTTAQMSRNRNPKPEENCNTSMQRAPDVPGAEMAPAAKQVPVLVPVQGIAGKQKLPVAHPPLPKHAQRYHQKDRNAASLHNANMKQVKAMPPSGDNVHMEKASGTGCDAHLEQAAMEDGFSAHIDYPGTGHNTYLEGAPGTSYHSYMEHSQVARANGYNVFMESAPGNDYNPYVEGAPGTSQNPYLEYAPMTPANGYNFYTEETPGNGYDDYMEGTTGTIYNAYVEQATAMPGSSYHAHMEHGPMMHLSGYSYNYNSYMEHLPVMLASGYNPYMCPAPRLPAITGHQTYKQQVHIAEPEEDEVRSDTFEEMLARQTLRTGILPMPHTVRTTQTPRTGPLPLEQMPPIRAPWKGVGHDMIPGPYGFIPRSAIRDCPPDLRCCTRLPEAPDMLASLASERDKSKCWDYPPKAQGQA